MDPTIAVSIVTAALTVGVIVVVGTIALALILKKNNNDKK